MASKYWFSTGVDAHWDTRIGNWWNDAAHTIQAAAIPVAGDSVYLLGMTAPDSGPAAPLDIIGFDTSGLTIGLDDGGATVTTNLRLMAGAILLMGIAGDPVTFHIWYGSMQAGASGVDASFQGSGNCGGDIIGTVRLLGTASDLQANVTGDVYVNDGSAILPPSIISGNAYVDGTSNLQAGVTVIGNVELTHGAGSAADIDGDLTVDDTSYVNGGTVLGTTRISCPASETSHTGTFNDVIVLGALVDLSGATVSGRLMIGAATVSPPAGVDPFYPPVGAYPSDSVSIGPYPISSEAIGPYPVTSP